MQDYKGTEKDCERTSQYRVSNVIRQEYISFMGERAIRENFVSVLCVYHRGGSRSLQCGHPSVTLQLVTLRPVQV